MTLRTFSYGGGVQSTAALVLAAQGKIDFQTFLFCNVGDDSELPDTLRFVRDVAIPWAAERGIEVLELARKRRDGTTATLWSDLMRDESRSLPIPIRMANGAPGNRNCTETFKIKVVDRWQREHGGLGIVGLGISTDEIQRARIDDRKEYPLIDLGLNRADCGRVITDAGLPMPRKSACFFCPFHRPSEFKRMQAEEPELFARSVLLEDTLNRRRDKLGKDHVYLTRFARPLTEAVGAEIQGALDLDGDCDSGYCMT